MQRGELNTKVFVSIPTNKNTLFNTKYRLHIKCNALLYCPLTYKNSINVSIAK